MKNNQTLAQYISSIRENLGLSQKGLAIKANVELEIIENVESGQDLFLSTSVRQKIARALKLETRKIKSFEKQPLSPNEVSLEHIEELRHRILSGQLTNNACPVCGAELICRIEEMYDLEDNLIKHPKARCSKCPFQIK